MAEQTRVLLIDHSTTAVAIMTKLIHKHIPGTVVDIATTYDEAAPLLLAHKYDLLTMSRNLPDMECHQMVEKIRTELNIRRTPLIVVSGEAMGIFEEQLACHYVNGYFDKKLGQAKLVAYIKSFISSDPPQASYIGNILYVEDSATVAQAIKNMLTRNGHNYLFAKDAEHALQHIQHSFTGNHIQPFDMLLTDIQLEGHMSGRDLIREIRHGLGLGYEELPILVTTASNFDQDPRGLNRIFSAGANDIIEKPIQEPLLISRINTLLSLRQLYLKLNPSQRLRASPATP